MLLKGAGGSEADFHFLFLIKKNSSDQEFFPEWKILFLAKVIKFINREYTYIVHANFHQVFQKTNFNIYLLLEFLR